MCIECECGIRSKSDSNCSVAWRNAATKISRVRRREEARAPKKKPTIARNSVFVLCVCVYTWNSTNNYMRLKTTKSKHIHALIRLYDYWNFANNLCSLWLCLCVRRSVCVCMRVCISRRICHETSSIKSQNGFSITPRTRNKKTRNVSSEFAPNASMRMHLHIESNAIILYSLFSFAIFNRYTAIAFNTI